jgi:two-component system KDP operon response regulator KdpE
MTGDILIVEDDSSIAQFVAASLSAEGMKPRVCGTVRAARNEVSACVPQLVILDLGLPDEDGVSLIRSLRPHHAVPVLVLSARAQEPEKIAALDAGADDYLTKPFGVGELLARVRAMLRRASAAPPASNVLHIGDLVFDREAHTLTRRGEAVHLTPIEFKLFERLARAPGKVLTHRQLLADVWGSDQVDQLHYLRIYMGHLRAKIEDDPAQPRYLLTELGVGYRLADE